MKKKIIALIVTFCLLLSNISIINASIESDKKNNISTLDSKVKNIEDSKKNIAETEGNEDPSVP